jgi:hypothetical protein
MMPAMEAIKAEQQRSSREGRLSAAAAIPVTPTVPHFLPFTRWAAGSESFKSTFIAEEPKLRKKARLSWYHPDDTVRAGGHVHKCAWLRGQ